MHALITYLKNVRAELSHVVWPSWQTGVAHTVLIVGISALIGFFIGALDYLFTRIVAFIIGV